MDEMIVAVFGQNMKPMTKPVKITGENACVRTVRSSVPRGNERRKISNPWLSSGFVNESNVFGKSVSFPESWFHFRFTYLGAMTVPTVSSSKFVFIISVFTNTPAYFRMMVRTKA